MIARNLRKTMQENLRRRRLRHVHRPQQQRLGDNKFCKTDLSCSKVMVDFKSSAIKQKEKDFLSFV